MIVANSEHRLHPYLSGLELFAKVAQNLAAGELLPDISHLITAANLIALDKGAAKIRSIPIGGVMGRLIINSLMTGISPKPRHIWRLS